MTTTTAARTTALADYLTSAASRADQDRYDEAKLWATDECPACPDTRGHGPSATCALGQPA